MSTRAVYTFIGDGESHHVYKHHDGYPSGAAEWITNALGNAWKLPRYEADEFAASFVAANKSCQGGVRLTRGYESHGDLEYRYEIRAKNGVIHVTAFDVSGRTWAQIFAGSLVQFAQWAKVQS
jgi:hypothetical protein